MKNTTICPPSQKEGGFIKGKLLWLVFPVFFIMLLSTPAFSLSPPYITQVKIQGSHYIKEDSIRKLITSKPGEVLSKDKIAEDMKAIYDMGYFFKIRALKEETPEGIILIYEVSEYPLVDKVEFVGVKASELKKIKRLVTLEVGKPWNYKKAQESKKKILDYFRSNGYVDAKLDFSPPPAKAKSFVFTFNIKKGQRARVMEVEISGNHFFPDTRLRSFMQTRFKRYFDPDLLKKDIKKLIEKYREEGFYFVSIHSPEFKFFEKYRVRWVRIFLKIDEGKRFRVRKIALKGSRIFPEKQLIDQIRPKEGEVFNTKKFEKSLQRIQSMYGDKGYLYAVIKDNFKFDKENGWVDIELSVQENIQVHLGKIKLEGNKTTKWRAFKHTLLLQEGDIFSIGKLRESWRRLYNLGFFDRVEMEPLYTSDPSVLDLLIRVEEKERTGKLLLGASYSSTSGIEGFFQLSKDNLWGEGKMLSVECEFGKKKNNYQLSYTDRWWQDTPTRLQLDVYNQEYKFYNEEGYIKKSSGGKISIGRPWFSNFTFYLTLMTQRTKISSVEGVPLPSDLSEGESAYQSLKPAVIWDSRVRDEAFNSYSGLYGSVSVEKSGGFLGGNVDFTKYLLDLRKYFRSGKFWRSPILALRLRGKWGNNLPFDEEFYTGGQDTLRGYRQNEFKSPRVLLGTVELRIPLTQEVLSYIFFDGADIQYTSTKQKYKTGFGFGMRMSTPIGIIRLDYGIGEQGRPRIYFGMGDVF